MESISKKDLENTLEEFLLVKDKYCIGSMDYYTIQGSIAILKVLISRCK